MVDVVVSHINAPIATITLNRPDALNALTNQLKQALLDALVSASSNPDVRAIIVTGAGRAFSAGQDLKEHAELLEGGQISQLFDSLYDHYLPIIKTIAGAPKPVIAGLGGVTVGAALAVACACDLRIAAASAQFNTGFAGVGLSGDTGITWSLPRVVGPGRAKDLLLRPRTIDATEALNIGLVNELVDDAEFSARLEQVGRELANGPTVALAGIKACLEYSQTHSLADSLDFEAETMRTVGATVDHLEAVRAFAAKQKPIYEGR